MVTMDVKRASVRMVLVVKWSGLSEGPYLKFIDTVDPIVVLEFGVSRSYFTKVYTSPQSIEGMRHETEHLHLMPRLGMYGPLLQFLHVS
jgi:hypothetical protein